VLAVTIWALGSFSIVGNAESLPRTPVSGRILSDSSVEVAGLSNLGEVMSVELKDWGASSAGLGGSIAIEA
jgi:hypothetical protein